MLQIRKAKPQELDTVMALYDHARQYMRENGNLNQWIGGYPSREMVAGDIDLERCFLCCEDDAPQAVFCFTVGEDETYRRICEGAWKDDEPYAVIHRMGVCSHRGGVASFCFGWCFAQHPNLRVDTHRDNIPMQHCLAKNGFAYCGIVYLADGSERLAYQKTR